MWSMEVAIQQFVEVLNVMVILLPKIHNISYHTTPARDLGQPVYCKCKCKCIPIPPCANILMQSRIGLGVGPFCEHTIETYCLLSD